jgi:SAM-dependent methyltransferase
LPGRGDERVRNPATDDELVDDVAQGLEHRQLGRNLGAADHGDDGPRRFTQGFAQRIELCRKYPDLAATVVDSPQALKAARANVAAENMGDRIELREGDFWKDDLGSGYDVALLFNIIHAFSPEQNTELFRRVRAALNPGGFVVILEQLVGKVPGPTARAINAIFQLNYFHLLGGSIYSFDEIAGWLADAGFTTPRRVNLLKAPGSALVLATRPAG